jgi:hypothetical protein
LKAHADEVAGRGVFRDLSQLDTGTMDDNPLHTPIEICTQYTKTRNKRYQPLNFWPSEVSGKDLRTAADVDYPEPGKAVLVRRTRSRRGRWFTINGQNLVSRDIASSQYQIIAVVTGDPALEARASSMKREFAQELWDRAQRREITLSDTYRGPKDPVLVAAGKVILLRHGYNGTVGEIHRELKSDPDAYGLGFGTQSELRALIDRSTLLQSINAFKEACREVANVAIRRDPYAGVIFRDPYDGSTIRWNPIRRGRSVKHVVSCWKCSKAVPDAVLPSRCRTHSASVVWEPCTHDVHERKAPCRRCPICQRCCKIVSAWEPIRVTDAKLSVMPPAGLSNANGDYPVNEPKLRNLVQPCLVHVLDSMFASLVVDELARVGVTDVIAIHDAWLVSAEDEGALLSALDRAGRAWLLKLKSVYDDIAAYLTATPYEDWWGKCRKKWQERIDAEKWPNFVATRQVVHDEDEVIGPQNLKVDG